LKNDVNACSDSTKQKKLGKINFVGVLKVTDGKKDLDPEPLVRGTDLRIRTKM